MKFVGFGALLLSLFFVIGCGSKNVDSSGSTSKSTTEKDQAPEETTIKDGNFEVNGGLDVNGNAPDGGSADSGEGDDSNANASNEGEENSDEMATTPTDDDGVALDSLATIYFNFDKYDIRDDMKDYVKGNAKLIKDKDIKSIVLQGNTDEFGSDEYNMALGQKRALAVRDALVLQGLPKNMFKTISYGTHKPVCKDKTPECYAKNRRTDIVESK
ncbi:OmpA family protein [Helicobacter saguini]|uniref:OmpA family protein n=1 Tax=Helicobacter saguini TaxID=1548018 RepID=A0A347VPN9_9HELI|nr:OmpA family protein [Helicobacter saguini]MWV61279.1 OmpA family protein [Helicobacter saguini]MWV68054.1 OmpA family protein [Helicobacter saguini]MWV70483.1 OmpA family protein [Helicobacter saguini]MWV72384.1 OmpA family protein [Helicobacter saguini]TLD92345.1 hypothetical protein LS64_010520 [Helicobacter saguini]